MGRTSGYGFTRLIFHFSSLFFSSEIFQVKENPGPINGGLAPIYGAAGKIPDRGMVQELLVNYMDSTC